MSMGAKIRKGDAVKSAGKEGPLDQTLGIHVDPHQLGFALLESVKNEGDFMERAPAVGNINLGEELNGDSIRSHLASRPDLIEDLYLNPNHDGFKPFSEFSEDDYAVHDADWLEDPRTLIWKSSLLAQLKAKDNALAHFEQDPASVQFGEDLDEEMKAALAQRARELAEELRNEALMEIDADVIAGQETARKIVRDTERIIRELATEDKDSDELSHQDVDKLFEGVE